MAMPAVGVGWADSPPWEVVRPRISSPLVLRVKDILWLGCRKNPLPGPLEMLTSWKHMDQLLNRTASELGEQD